MRTIYKYPIMEDRDTTVTMPKDAKIFSAAIDAFGQICVWAAVNTDEEEKEERELYVIGTGFPFDTLEEGFGYKFIDTIVDKHSGFVFHVFEITDKGCNCQTL